LQFSQGIGRNPAGGSGVNFGDGFCLGDRSTAEADAAFADLAQRPVDGFPYEVAVIGRLASDHGQEFAKNVVGQVFSPDGCAGHEYEAGAFHKLRPLSGPLQRFLDGERHVWENFATDLVADVPGVEVACPAVGLGAANLGRIFNQGGENSRFVDFAGPEFERKRMVLSVRACERSQHGNTYAEMFGFRRDAEPALAGNVNRVPERTQVGDELGRGHRNRTVLSEILATARARVLPQARVAFRRAWRRAGWHW